MIIIFPPPPLVGPLKSYQVDHLVTATFGTLCQHTTQSPLKPSSLSSSPLSFLFKIFSLPLKEKNPFIPIPPPAPGPHGWYFYLPTISNRVSGPQIKWSVLNAHLKWVQWMVPPTLLTPLKLRIGNPCPTSGPIENRHRAHRFASHRLPMSIQPIRYRHFTLLGNCMQTHSWGRRGRWIFAFFGPEKKKDFNKYKRILILWKIGGPNSLDFFFFFN